MNTKEHVNFIQNMSELKVNTTEAHQVFEPVNENNSCKATLIEQINSHQGVNNTSNLNGNSADNAQSSPQTQTQTSQSQQNRKYSQPALYIPGLLQKIDENIRQKQIQKLVENLHQLVSDQNQFYLMKYSQKIGNIGIGIAQIWANNADKVLLLQYLGFLMMPNKDTRTIYDKIIRSVSETVLKTTIQYYQKRESQNNNVEMVQQQQQKQEKSQTQQQEMKPSLQLEPQFVQVQHKQHKNQKLNKTWQLYIELLKSYNYQCLKLGLSQQNWFIYWLTFSSILQSPQIDTKSPLSHLHTPIPQLLHTLVTKYPNFLQEITYSSSQLFHKLAVLCRIFISCTQTFLSTNNLLVTACQKYPITNNCTLLMNFVYRQFQKMEQNQQNQQNNQNQTERKLDCLMLLMTIVQGKIKKCQNYNKVLQFITTIVTYVIQCEQNNQNQVTFYLGQLVAMVFYRNCQWVVQYCRKQKNKTLEKLLKVYTKSVKKAVKHVDHLEYEHVVYKRLVFGLCGMLYLTKMDSVLQNCIQKIFPDILRIVQAQHGWKQPQNQPQQPKMILSSQSPYSPQSQSYTWDQQYYTCNNLKQFQHLQQVQQLVKSVYTIKNNNQQIFVSIMNNFDQKQSIMWIAELESYGERVQNQNWDQEYDNGNDQKDNEKSNGNEKEKGNNYAYGNKYGSRDYEDEDQKDSWGNGWDDDGMKIVMKHQ